MAETEAGPQYLAILSQPAHQGKFSNSPIQITLLAIAEPSRLLLTPDNRLLCFILHVQPGTGTTYWVTGYCDWRIQ